MNQDLVVPKEANPTTYGVIVARFQVDQLHEGHIYLIDTVSSRHEHLVIVLGLSHGKSTKNNPLDFESRKQMILESYPDAIIRYIADCRTNEEWSNNLDKLIGGLPELEPEATLYGSRDSFAPYYLGSYPVVELEQKGFVSGTKLRKDIVSRCRDRNADFRKGCLFTTMNQWAKNEMCIDVALFNDDKSEILLGRKEGEEKFRFIGGFVEGDTFEDAVIKEAKEEAGNDLELSQPIPHKSFRIDDWRYRGESNKLLTMLYETTILWGRPEAGDDICEVRWFTFCDDLPELMVDNHNEMMEYLVNKYQTL